jgi:hypothetical protein
MAQNNLTPLGRWLKRRKIRQNEFAATLSKLSGFEIPPPRICEWAHHRAPSRTNQALIEEATNGEVKSLAWKRWRKANQRARAQA